MKKNGFLEGAMVATLGIVVCKIIGLFYVIPFYAIIGTQGGALYSYAYSIYAIFLSLSNSGIPVAMSRVISEYNTLGYYNTKERAYKIGSYLIVGIGFFFFLVLLVFAPMLAKTILGSSVGGNTVEGVTLVIRIVATALLIVPVESVAQGYLQGQKFILPSSMANVIEQVVRVTIILIGSFTALRVFHLSIDTVVGIAVFAATLGALVAYFYLLTKIKKNKAKLNRDISPNLAERRITSKQILKKIILYALPFVIIDVMNSAYGIVDTLTVVNTMTSLGYSTKIAESSLGVIATWASKLNMIIAAIALGVSTSLIPSVASAYVKGDHVDLNRKINQSLQALIFTTIPMALGLSFLATPVWVIFYGFDQLSINIFTFYIFMAIIYSFYTVLIDIMQTLNCSKISLSTLLFSFIFKYLLNAPLMILFTKIGLEAYYAPIFATILIQGCAILFLMHKLRQKFNIHYMRTFVIGLKTILCVAIMFVALSILNLFIPVHTTSRMMAILLVLLYTLVGVVVYIVCTFKSKVIYEIFGEKLVNTILNKIPFIKRVSRS